jgi:predicted RNA-binding protein associated with RNAse of E/G family
MPDMSGSIIIIKRNLAGEETWRYPGRLLIREGTRLVLEARFNRPDLPFMGIVLKAGDRFVETYYTDRWYNIYEIHDRDDDGLKGWYCNISRPAVLEAEDQLSYVDLALDLWIAPDGTQTVLDEEEFAVLDLEAESRAQARQALEDLQARFAQEMNRPAF